MGSKSGLMVLGVAFAAICLTGCAGQPRFKGLDSYASATTTNTYDKLPPMDPYSYGGTAYASGGLEPAASYGTGAPGQFDGSPAHYEAVIARDGNNAPPVDWGTGASDTSGLISGSEKPVTEISESDR